MAETKKTAPRKIEGGARPMLIGGGGKGKEWNLRKHGQQVKK